MALVAVPIGRRLTWIVGLVAACLAAVVVAGHIGAGSLSFRLAGTNSANHSRDSWAGVPLAARDAISQDLGAAEHQFSVTRTGTALVSRGSKFSATFGRDGAVVRGGSGTALQLGLEAIGRGRSLFPVGRVSPVGRANVVSYNRYGLDESYTNGPLGLEQRFIVDRRVSGAGELTLVVGRVPAGARASIGSQGTSLVIRRADGTGGMLRYSDLAVIDAARRQVPATIDVSGGRILIRVDDGSAQYPLQIDPTVQAGGAVLTGASGYDQPGYFGTSVAVSEDGSTIAVGDPQHGEVDVFTVPANGDWQDATPTAELTVTDGTYRSLGYSVAVSADGSTIVAGALTDPSSGHLGAAYVFRKPVSGGWQNATQTAELTASDGVSNDDFGWSVAVSGDGAAILVGAPGQIAANVLNGTAYLFIEPASGGWQNATQTAELTASDGALGDEFGYSVSASDDGEQLVVGALEHEVGSALRAGAVYVFSEPTSGGWQNATQTAEFTASDSAINQYMGSSVAMSGNGGTVVAGAWSEAYVFSKPPSGGWETATQTAELTVPALANVEPSMAVSDDGGTVVAGSFFGAYVFSEPESGWQNAAVAAQLRANYDVSGGGYGMPVAMSGDGATVAWANPWAGNVQLFPPAPADLSPPTVSGSPVSGQQLSDTDGTWSGNATGYLYQWKDCNSEGMDCSPIAGATGQSYTLTDSDVGSTVEVQEAATNAAGGVGIAISSTTSEVVQPLSSTSLPTVSGLAAQGQALTETNAAWNATVTGRSYQWEDCDSSGQNCSHIAGATGQSYTLTSADVGSTIVVQETASNAGGAGIPTTSVATQVVQPLYATSPPTISGPAVQGQTLTETNASWNTTVSGYSYQWGVCDSTGSNCSPIAGATSRSYTLTNADAGSTIVVQETASNAGGAGIPEISAPTALVVPLPPVISHVPKISGTAIEGDTLNATPGTWTNKPTTFAYQWYDCDSTGQDCQPITGASGQTYTLAASDIGSGVAVEETATNAGGSSAPATSAATAAVPESGPVGLEIDNGDYATDNPTVTIEAAWPPGTQSVLIANNGGFRTNVETVAPAATIPWTLEQTGADRLPKTVYVRFLGVGQDDINFTDDIILDETAPTIQSATLGGAATDSSTNAVQASAARVAKLHTYKLSLKAKDLVVGVCAVATNQSHSSKGETLTPLTSCKARGILKVSRTVELKLASRPNYVRVQNSAGDWSRWTAVRS